MSNFVNDIILESDPNYTVISVNQPFELDSLRNADLYSYMANLDNFLETREENIDIIPLSKFDKSGEYNNILMADSNGMKWQQISNKIEGYINISSVFDETFLYQGGTMDVSYFNWLSDMSVTSTRIIPTETGGEITTKILTQDSGDGNWVKLSPSLTLEVTKFTLNSQVDSNANKLINFTTKKDNFDIVGATLVDTTGNISKVLSHVETIADEKYNDVTKSVSASKYSVSCIAEDGSITNWGQIGTSDRIPPTDVGKFKQVAGSYYTQVGLTDDGHIYGWGYSSYTGNKIVDYVPSEAGHRYVGVGFDFGIAIDQDYNLVHWGSTTRVNVDLLPPRYTSVTDGLTDKSADDFVKVIGSYKVGGALRRDGRLHVFGAADFYNLIAQAPTYDDIVDFDFTYKSGIYLRANGEVGQWGSFYYPIPDFQGKTIVKVIGGKYIHQAITSDNYVYTWGSSTLTNVIGAYRTGVIDTISYDYIGVYVNEDFTVRPFTSVTTASPQAEVNNNAPSPTSYLSRKSGLVVDGYSRSYIIENELLSNDFYITTANLGYHILSGDYRDVSFMTLFSPQTYTLLSEGLLEIKYIPVDINTDKLTFYYSTRTNYEVCTRLQFDLDKEIVGE